MGGHYQISGSQTVVARGGVLSGESCNIRSSIVRIEIMTRMHIRVCRRLYNYRLTMFFSEVVVNLKNSS